VDRADLGIQKGVQKLLGLRKLPSPERTARAGAIWAPYRTVATWYLWRSLELPE
jgi:DNA-3-methyladenine glycosylase II